MTPDDDGQRAAAYEACRRLYNGACACKQRGKDPCDAFLDLLEDADWDVELVVREERARVDEETCLMTPDAPDTLPATVEVYPLSFGDVLDGQYWIAMHYQRLLTSQWRVQAMRPENREAAFFGFILWMEAMRQDPAGTLPVDDGELTMLAGLGMDRQAWARVRDFALRKWAPVEVEADDGEYVRRLAHPFVTRVVVRAMTGKRKAAAKVEAGVIYQKRSRVRRKLASFGTIRGEPPEAAVEFIASWLHDQDMTISEANVRLGWDHYIGRRDGTGKL